MMLRQLIIRANEMNYGLQVEVESDSTENSAVTKTL